MVMWKNFSRLVLQRSLESVAHPVREKQVCDSFVAMGRGEIDVLIPRCENFSSSRTPVGHLLESDT